VDQGKRGLLKPIKDTVAPPQTPDAEAVEIDELWSFVQKKSHQAWVWIAISYQSRQVLAMVVGDRSAHTCRKLWDRLPDTYKAFVVFTDFYEAYRQVIPREQHQPFGKGSGRTNTVERFNNTLRQRVGRLVRKTLSFSKSVQMHLLCLRLFVDEYNRYCIKRFKLRTTG
jgi:insertion element IS1 protein InsB